MLVAGGVRVAINECDPLNVITHVVIILVPPHYQVLLRLLQTQIPHLLSTVPGDVDVGEILPGLTVILLVCKTRQVLLLHIYPLNRGRVIGGLTRCYSVHRVINLRPILYDHLL